MKSIRLSLVAYFLILLAGALGAVSWLVYQTASRTLHEKEQSTADLVRNTCEQDINAQREAFDKMLLAEAEKINSLCNESSQHHEFYYPLGMLAAAPMPMAHLLMPLWIAEGAHPAFVGTLEGTPIWNPVVGTGSWLSEASSDKITARLSLKGADHPEDLANEVPADRSHEFIQIERPLFHYLPSNRPFGIGRDRQRQFLVDQLKTSYPVKLTSESLGNQHLPMSDKTLEDHRFDNVELASGTKLRQVIIGRFAASPKSGQVIFRSPQGELTGKIWATKKYLNPGPPPKDPGKGKDDKGKSKATAPRVNLGSWEFLPFVFIHYAQDTASLDGKILELQEERDKKIEGLKNATQSDLHDLRDRLAWIGGSTFVGILVGSWLLIALGLSPLSRLSDAVSKVTPRDFRLQIDQANLPRELMPIAGRMSDTLAQLGKAFAREKQAAADISHELRTPLAALLTTAEVGLKKSRSPEEYRELLQDCRLSGEQMMMLVERLLALARLDANADQPRFLELDRVAVGETQPLQGRPLLAGGLDVLPWFLADRASGGRRVAGCMLRSTRRADVAEHGGLHVERLVCAPDS